MNNYVEVNALEGLVITSITNGYKDKLPSEGDSEIQFHTACGRTFSMFHQQSCCESVAIEEIIGDLGDLLDTPMVSASEDEGRSTNEEDKHGNAREWTFYNLRTHKGTVTIRWYGTSNGYYSTSVSFAEVLPDNAGTRR